MKIQDQTFRNLFNLFLAVIASAIILRKPCTFLLIGFVVLNLLYIKNIKLGKNVLLPVAVIALPFLLEILFFWNNSTLSGGLKAAEKTVSMLLLPLFILGHYKSIDFYKVLFYFGRIIMLVMAVCLIRFLIVYPEHVQKYLNGIDLFEAGYFFAASFKSHAPAANMHLAFAGVVNFYFALCTFQKTKAVTQKIIALFFVGLSVFFVLLVNTRMALGAMILGYGIVLVYEILKVKNGKKILQFASLAAVVVVGVLCIYLQNNPYMKEKYTKTTFENLDKVGRLDELEHPEYEAYSGLVMRLSTWKAAWELGVENLPFGVGSADGKQEIVNYYTRTGQKFLAGYKLPAHNQFLDMMIRFGIAGALAFLVHIFTILWLGIKTRNAIIISFFVLFFLANMVDDFLIRFDGIVFSALWFSVFWAYWLQKKVTPGTAPAAL